MRIARFTTGEDPQFGVVHGDVDDLGIPADDAV
ncbi:MAG: Rv2993c-like domain-containing protein, partial [Actinomycetes bacterium]